MHQFSEDLLCKLFWSGQVLRARPGSWRPPVGRLAARELAAAIWAASLLGAGTEPWVPRAEATMRLVRATSILFAVRFLRFRSLIFRLVGRIFVVWMRMHLLQDFTFQRNFNLCYIFCRTCHQVRSTIGRSRKLAQYVQKLP